MSMPASLASRRASGEEKTRPPSCETAARRLRRRRCRRGLVRHLRGRLRQAGVAGDGVGGAGGFAAGGARCLAGGGAAAALTSSPSPGDHRDQRIDRHVLRCPPARRSWRARRRRSPRTSIVALSVSISAITSPALTLSPSFLSHRARLPFSIVGDSAGIRMLIGMMGSCRALADRAGGAGIGRRIHLGLEHGADQFERLGFGELGLVARKCAPRGARHRRSACPRPADRRRRGAATHAGRHPRSPRAGLRRRPAPGRLGGTASAIVGGRHRAHR